MWRFQHAWRYSGVTAYGRVLVLVSCLLFKPRMSDNAAVTALQLYLLRKQLHRQKLFTARWNRSPSGRLT